MCNGSKTSSKVNVGFVILVDENWLGGINYYRNLLEIICEDTNKIFEPIIFTNNRLINKYFNELNVPVIYTGILKKYNFLWFLDKVCNKLFKREFLLENLLKKHNISIVSHSLWNIKNILQLPWIPDFQHKYLPELFSTTECKYRDDVFKKYAEFGDLVILSSQTAKNDFCESFVRYKEKACVLSFVVSAKDISKNTKYVLNKYNITKPFFYLPNQFWQHKNHKVVLEALTYLKDTNITVYCTGNTEDYRNKKYFNELLEYIRINQLDKCFKILGIVPYQDVQALTVECKAIINPSLFEGWSTTVEEAKSMGKRIILSDIDVHKEQNPEGGLFFDRNNSKDLAEKMFEVWNEQRDINDKLKRDAMINLAERKRDFRENYYKILSKCIEEKHESEGRKLQ